MSKAPVNNDISGEIKNENRFERPEIPKEVISELAGFFLPDIIAFFESEEGKRKYEEWKNNNKKNLLATISKAASLAQ